MDILEGLRYSQIFSDIFKFSDLDEHQDVDNKSLQKFISKETCTGPYQMKKSLSLKFHIQLMTKIS